MSTPHPEAKILRAIADGQTIQQATAAAAGGEWRDLSPDEALRILAGSDMPVLRVKPPTVRIGEFDVPEPARDPLPWDAPYWMPVLEGSLYHKGVYEGCWKGSDSDLDRLRLGFVHLTEEAAALHFEALTSFTRSH